MNRMTQIEMGGCAHFCREIPDEFHTLFPTDNGGHLMRDLNL